MIFVSGLPTNVTTEELALFFGAIGPIKKSGAGCKQIFIYKNNKSLPTGWASVTYHDPKVAQKAVGQFDQKIFNGNLIRVSKAGEMEKVRDPWASCLCHYNAMM